MGTGEDPDFETFEDFERQRQEAVDEAFLLMERHPDYPDVRVQTHDRDLLIKACETEETKIRMSDARLDFEMKFFDNRAEQVLRLITDLESQNAYIKIMDFFVRKTWESFSAIPIESVPPTSPFAPSAHPSQIQRDKLRDRERYWIMEGYRRIATLRKPTTQTRTAKRRGYRLEVKAWMKRIGIESQKQAAKRLGVSIDVLKSIMSGKGKKRFSDETLRVILEKIGVTD